jgi:ATP-dependent RNA helicase RhlE
LTTFADLGLHPDLLKAVAEQGYTEPTPIQAQAIPLVLAGRDLMGGAQTGTGKTAAFALPILQRLAPHASTSASPARHPVRALILTPTRELALQVEESFRDYGKHVGLRIAVVYGGVPIEPQMQQLRSGVEILVATPGRLLDHVHQRTVNLSQVEIFVLDEADRMLDMGFIPDVRRILALLTARKQGLLFSATFSDEIKKLADAFLRNPVLVEVARRNAAAELVSHLVHPVARERKRDLLVHLIKARDMKQVLVFTATRLGANRLAYQLNRSGVHAAAIHGDKTQTERIQALEEFKAGKVGVLVATDVAARGLDIEQLPYVLNFELPNSPEDYVHRSGRTGRAGSTGLAISLVCGEETERLAEIERMIKVKIEREILPGFGPDVRDAPGLMTRPDRDRRRGADEPRLTGGRRAERAAPSAPKPAARPLDPIFSKPYEPSEAPPAERQRAPQKRERQVAALLGGFIRKPG